MKFKHTYRRAADCVSAPEELTNTVLQIPKQTKPHGISRPLRLVAAAAVLALVIGAISFWPVGDKEYVTGPGVLAIEAHAVNEDTGEVTITTLKDGIDIPAEYEYWISHSYVEDFKLTVMIPEEDYGGVDISIEIRTNTGTFKRYGVNDPIPPFQNTNLSYAEQLLELLYGQKFAVPNGTTVYWNPIGTDYELLKQQVNAGNTDFNSMGTTFFHETNPSYVDIIIRAGKYIVGYGVIAVTRTPITDDPASGIYSFDVITIKSFPVVNGQFQHVPLEYVEELIESHK